MIDLFWVELEHGLHGLKRFAQDFSLGVVNPSSIPNNLKYSTFLLPFWGRLGGGLFL